MFQRKKRRIPGLNTASTADISFMLLIFFLVTASMDMDKGLQRQLPPLEDEQEEQVIDMNRSYLMKLTVTADNQLLVNDTLTNLPTLRQQIINFVEHCPDRQQHVISVEVAREATYDVYFNMQNEIVGAYRMLREQRAQQLYKRSYSQCTEAQRDSIRAYYPQRIAEVYPKGGDE